MKYSIKRTKQFKKDYKLAKNRGFNMALIDNLINMLANGEPLAQKYKDHALIGNYKGYRECHVTPDWLLIYRVDNNELILTLTHTGSHSDLF